jgi:hypothetical protein
MAAPDRSAWPIKLKTGSKLGVFKKRKEVNDAKKDHSVPLCPCDEKSGGGDFLKYSQNDR